MCKFIIFYGKMSRIDFRMQMLFSPSSHNGLFSLDIIIIIIILFLTERQWRNAPPRPVGPSRLPSATLRPGRPGRGGGPTPPLSLGLTHGLVNGRTEAASSGEGVCPPRWRPSAAPPGSCRGSNCISQGPSAFP